MKDANVWWQLDGALNISLQKGEYIGAHVDVDISVLHEDVEKLETYLRERGYALFLRKKEGEERILRRVGAKAFQKGEGWQTRFAAVNERGEIQKDADLVSVEVAVIEKDKEGKPRGLFGVELPEKWLEGKMIDFKGVPIELSHPARFLFNKIWFTRGYDEGDLRVFSETGALSSQDVDEVERLAEPILENFEKESDEEKKFATLVRDRFKKLREWLKTGQK